MGTGYLMIQATAAGETIPVQTHVEINRPDGVRIYDTDTNANGVTEDFPLSAPDKQYTLDPEFLKPAYSICDVTVTSRGYVTLHIHGVEIVDTQHTILPVNMEPIVDEPNPVTEMDIYIPPVGLLVPNQDRQTAPPSPRAMTDIVVPDYITVHLGLPNNSAARNVRVKFIDYIKNVVSSEIYSTWPQNSLLANTHVIVTFALNRVYTEWYRSRGFNFDITNSTSYDQYYRDGGVVFENIGRIVDSYFNMYVRRIGFRNPFFTSFCNGTTSTCAGLSQWGTVTLANQGRSVLEILRYYYPNDVELGVSNNITGIVESFPGYSLSVGSSGESVRRMQKFLNRIRVNFPLIPPISNPNGVFGTDTQNAVRTFQRTFNLMADGVIGRATWNRISFMYVGVTRLAELDSEGERITIGLNPPNVVLSQGSRGEYVLELQFILNVISSFYPSVPTVIKDNVFGSELKNAVIEFQKTFGLNPDGVVGPGTWNKLYAVYRGIEESTPIPPNEAAPSTGTPEYPGTPLRIGSTGPNVRLIQTQLNTIRIVYPDIPYLIVDGNFGPETQRAVIAFQQQFLLTPDGIIGLVTWNKIIEQYLLVTGDTSISLEYPGSSLRIGSTGNSVRLVQQFLSDIRSRYPSLPAVTADGIFGPQTETAVITFQRIMGLTPDGIIGPVTWYAIIRERNAIV